MCIYIYIYIYICSTAVLVLRARRESAWMGKEGWESEREREGGRCAKSGGVQIASVVKMLPVVACMNDWHICHLTQGFACIMPCAEAAPCLRHE